MHSMAKIPALFLLTAFFTTQSQAITVDEAYRAIPHNRTVFDAQLSALPAAQSKVLDQLFELCDRGVVLRVEGLQALQSNSGDLRLVSSRYDALARDLSALAASAEIEPARALVLQAVRLHQQYFETIERAKAAGRSVEVAYRQNPVVKQASQKLISAYSVLMKSFPKEPSNNRQALCALDFL